SDVAGLDVLEHPLGFSMAHHRVTAHRFEMICLANRPALGVGVQAGALLVVLGAFASRFVLFGNPHPYSYRLMKNAFGHGVDLHFIATDTARLVPKLVFRGLWLATN